MAYQTSDIVTLVQKRVRDTGYDTGEIKQYLNDTQNDVFNEYRLPFMEATQAYTTVANVADITNGVGLPTNYTQAIDLYATSTHLVIPYIDIREVDQYLSSQTNNTTSLSGLSWSLYGLTPFLTPTPTVSYGLTLRYYKKPTLLSADADVPSIPSQFQELLVVGAAYRVLQVKDNYDQAAILQNKYDELLDKMVLQSAVKQVGAATTMAINRYPTGKRNF